MLVIKNEIAKSVIIKKVKICTKLSTKVKELEIACQSKDLKLENNNVRIRQAEVLISILIKS